MLIEAIDLLDSNCQTSRKIWDCHIRVTASFALVILSGKHDENIRIIFISDNTVPARNLSSCLALAELVVFLGRVEALGERDPSRLGFEIDGGPPWPKTVNRHLQIQRHPSARRSGMVQKLGRYGERASR